MPTLLESLRSTIRNVFCATATPASVLLQLGGGIYKGFGSTENGDDLIAGANAVDAAAALACNREPANTEPSLAPQFSGGQCPGTIYAVNYTAIADNANTGFPQTFNQVANLTGPISNVTTGPLPNQISATYYRGPIEGVGPAAIFTTGTNFTFTSVQVNGVSRNDGQPDNCGDGPLVPPAYNPNDWTSTPTVDYDDNNGNPVSIQPTLKFEPGDPVGGTDFNVPFTVEFPSGNQVFGDFNLTTGDINIGVGNGSGQGPGNLPRELGPGENPEETNSIVIGARVVCTRLPSGNTATEIDGGPNLPDLYVPRIGIVSFKHKTFLSEAWTKDYAVKRTEQVIWAEQPAINVAARPESGWLISVYPIICTEECSPCC